MSSKRFENEGWETNRYKKLTITCKAKFYCSCDMEMLGKGEKCHHHVSRKKPHGRIGGGKRKLKHY